MSDILIYTDSAADLPLKYAQDNNVTIIPFYITFDGSTYYKEGVELNDADFFDKISQGITPKTSCPSVEDYTNAFQKGIDDGKKIVCICLSSKLSGSYQSALIAAEEFNDGEQRVFVIDSQLATGSQGLLVKEAVKMSDDGFDGKAIFDKMNEIKETGIVDFIIDDLVYLQKGGRIGKVSSLLGTLLNIKPVIVVKDGELFPLNKIRGRKKAAAYIKSLIKDIYAEHGDDYVYGVLNFEAAGDDDGFTDALEGVDMDVFPIGCTIGSHVGPSAAGVVYIKKYNK